MNGANPYVITFLLLHRTIGKCSLVHVRLLITKPHACYKETPSCPASVSPLLTMLIFTFLIASNHPNDENNIAINNRA